MASSVWQNIMSSRGLPERDWFGLAVIWPILLAGLKSSDRSTLIFSTILDLLCPWSSLFLFLFFHSSGGHSLKSKVSAGLCSFSRLGENTSLPIPASGDSKPSLACGYIIPISTLVFMEISPLGFDLFCVFRTSIIEFRGNTDNSGWSHFRILDLITSIKIFFFPNNVTSTGSRWTYLLGHDHSTHYSRWFRTTHPLCVLNESWMLKR